MNIIKEQSIEPFKQNNWDNRFAQLTTDQKNQLGLYLAAYENSPLAKESLPQFLLNGLGEVELENDKLNTQKILLDGINTDNSKMVAYAFARGASSNSEQNNRSPLAQALLVSSDEICELLLENKAEVSKELVQNAIYLEKTALAWNFVQKKRELINEGYLAPRNNNYINIEANEILLGTHALVQGNLKIAFTILSKEESSIRQIKMKKVFGVPIKPLSVIGQLKIEGVFGSLIKALGIPEKNKYALKILEKLIENGYTINDLWDFRNGDGLAEPQSIRSAPLYQKSVLELLIKCNANLNHVIIRSNNYSWTPLLCAITLDRKDAIEFLVDNGADINQKARPICQIQDDLSPIEYAIRLGRNDIVKLLTLKGAK